MTHWTYYLTLASITFGFFSAASWFYASFVKADHRQAMDRRKKEAEKLGVKPNYASVSLDGWDMSATFLEQAKWNAMGAFFAACSILSQAISQAL